MDKAGPDQAVATPRVGEPAPFFSAATDGIDRFSLDVTAGRWIVLLFFGSLGAAASRAALETVLGRRGLFDGPRAVFWGVSADPADRAERGLGNAGVALRYFWDFDLGVTRLFGLADATHFRPAIFLIDPSFRIAMAEPIEAAAAVMDRLEAELARTLAPEEAPFAPVLTLPRIFEPELCARLIDTYRRGAPTRSGFAADVDGRTVEQFNPVLKRRHDVTIEDGDLLHTVRSRLERNLFPMIRRALGWQAKHIERYLICRYGAEEEGFFFPHRDDVTAGSAHRRFAVTLNLNTEDYDGGALRFPEFGARTYRPPTGGATVFSCGLLHEATPVTRGERFAFVPFLFDDDDEKIRAANLARVADAS